MDGDALGFELPDFEAPLDYDALMASVPDAALVKGLFVDGLRRVVVARVPHGHARFLEVLPRPRYDFTRSYSRREVMQIELDVAKLLFPGVAIRQALRLAAREVYPIFHSSFWGRMILWPMRDDIGAILRLGPRAFRNVVNFGTVECERLTGQHIRYHYLNYYSWLDCGDLGVLEGLILRHGGNPEIRVRRGEGDFDLSLDIRW